MRRLGLLAALALGSLAVTACSTTPSAKRMRARELGLAHAHPASVGLHVEGGGGLDSRISNEAFEEAVRASLAEAGVFSDVVRIDQADFRLDAILGDCRQPAGGFDMTVEMTVLWSLSTAEPARIVWQALVESQHTATVGDAFAGVVRMREATEGAARKNIEEALRRLAAADLASRRHAGRPLTSHR